MGLASAMSTALTGLTAAETTIDVVGNNLANANTVGFKASSAAFATQFLQTQSLGSAPTEDNGGTNPRQLGLGAMVANVSPNFSQGTVEISSNPTDLAIQGDGFFIVQGNGGEQLYTRNGMFKMNADSQLVTMTGNRLLGYGVDDQYQIDTTTLKPITIPLGSAAVAKSTENAYLEGTLSPTGDLATKAAIIQSDILSDAKYSHPTTQATLSPSVAPNISAVTLANGNATPAGDVDPGTYYYRIVFADGSHDDGATEGTASVATSPVTVGATDDAVQLDNLPSDDTYSYVHIYRTLAGAASTGPYYYVGETTMGTGSFVDTKSDATIQSDANLLDENTISGNYSYYVTFAKIGGVESRPSPLTGPINVVGGRVHLSDLPTGDPTEWDVRRIYRNLSTDDSSFHLVTEIPNVDDDSATFTDNVSDSVIQSTSQIDLDGPKIVPGTLLKDVTRRDGSTYSNVFEDGTLHFTGRKGDRALTTRDLTITDETTVLELMNFMEQGLGIQKIPGPDPSHPIPPDASGANPGGSVTADGRIKLVGNNGTANAIGIQLSGMRETTATGDRNLNLPFTTAQTAVGESAVTDFIAYDSLGIPVSVRMTAVLESRTSTATTYRWFADSGDNDPAQGAEIAVGTGLISFDGEGNFATSNGDTVSIDRAHVSSRSPLEFVLNFSQLSGLAADKSTLAVSRQDGSAPGVLSSFIVGEDGLIRGVFSNGITRDLAQIRLARFGNPVGLEQKGQNLYTTGVNSGLPVQGNPGSQGIGSIVAGAVELSNADIGTNLIDLILASTMYRGNTRVITTAQQMFDELLSLRR